MSDTPITLYIADRPPFKFGSYTLNSALRELTASSSLPGSEIDNLVFSPQTNEMIAQIGALRPQTLSVGSARTDLVFNRDITLEETLFDACAAVKIELSKVSMHFSKDLIKRLNARIDQFHDPEEWENGEKTIQIQSLRTFIRWFYQAKPHTQPSFGMSHSGFLIASWMQNGNKDQLILEFFPKDKIKWFITLDDGGQKEYVSGETPLNKIDSRLKPYPLEQWFGKK